MRSRSSVALSLPVLLFTCLVLATNARAQDSVVFQMEVAASHSLFQVLVDRQQLPFKTAVAKAGLQVAVLSSAGFGGRAGGTNLPLVPASELRQEITPGQCFGNGAQAAP